MNKAILMIKRARKFNEAINPILDTLPKKKKRPGNLFSTWVYGKPYPVKITKRLKVSLKDYVTCPEKGATWT